jgi:hypothetical protein
VVSSRLAVGARRGRLAVSARRGKVGAKVAGRGAVGVSWAAQREERGADSATASSEVVVLLRRRRRDEPVGCAAAVSASQ